MDESQTLYHLLCEYSHAIGQGKLWAPKSERHKQMLADYLRALLTASRSATLQLEQYLAELATAEKHIL